MAPTKNGSIVFREPPTDYPIPGKTVVYEQGTIDLDQVPLNGGILVKTLWISIDPYLRGRLREAHVKSYLPAFTLGEVIFGLGVVVVLRSEKRELKAGDYLYVLDLPYQHYAVLSSNHPVTPIDNQGLSLSLFLGVLGMPGKTAYYGLDAIGKPKAGETIYISTGAGPVGATVAQLCKAKGLKVIASAGSDEKVEYMKSIGVDVPFNYKKEKVADVLAREGPLDIYWDNVGGETLEAAIDACSDQGARIVACGAISSYNGTRYGVKNTDLIFAKQLTIQGMFVYPLEAQAADPSRFFTDMVALIQRGELKYNESIWDELESVGEAILAVQKGTNEGKVVIRVSRED
ncbi:zinc-binding dehydrogenase [Rhizoctonia solani AG-3 Rhs1AP]|uniref:Zinc-binding dehydrogenase n=1 Tax=Rhizoctonia solani AG-3 Rhs1AP TaxID=1086054 RepID=X8IYW3_9AGAM|nr:zinc-binding dehydrogenase [Rhizoctonia solani AG-3 Rhs1AP]